MKFSLISAIGNSCAGNVREFLLSDNNIASRKFSRITKNSRNLQKFPAHENLLFYSKCNPYASVFPIDDIQT